MADESEILEVEWQFDAPDLERVIAWLKAANVPGYTVREGPVKRPSDTYYDTADWRIARGKFTCRVRQKGADAELTLKGLATMEEGRRSRREMNERVSDASPGGLVAAPGMCGNVLRLVAGRRHLAALFTLDQERATFILADDTGDLGEITVDDTRVRDSDARVKRVEVEVDAAAVDRSRRFVDVLIAAGGLLPGTLSKYQAGLAAVGLHAAPTETTLGSTAVAASMTAGEVGYAVLRRHFAVFLANEGGTRLGEDIEGLHDMRVAARRLRAAMQAFRPWAPVRMERFRLELGWVAAALGVVRDLDVQLERLAEWQAEDPARALALEAIATILNARRDYARKRMLLALDARRYDVFVERFAAVLRAGPPRSLLAAKEPILAVGPGMIDKRYRRLRRLGDAIKKDSPAADYHALRIDGKKLRYALEFLGPVYGAPATSFATRLTALQDVLGLHQDAEIASDLLGEIAATAGRRLTPETVLAMGAIQERYRLHGMELRASFTGVYKPLRGKEWSTLQKTMRKSARG